MAVKSCKNKFINCWSRGVGACSVLVVFALLRWYSLLRGCERNKGDRPQYLTLAVIGLRVLLSSEERLFFCNSHATQKVNLFCFAAKDLISRLLIVQPQQRLTIEQVMLHPWLVGHKLVPQTPLPTLEILNEERQNWNEVQVGSLFPLLSIFV